MHTVLPNVYRANIMHERTTLHMCSTTKYNFYAATSMNQLQSTRRPQPFHIAYSTSKIKLIITSTQLKVQFV